MAAVFLRPGHADPALGADAAAECAAVRVAVARPVRIEGAGGDLLGEERAHLVRAASRIRAAGGSGSKLQVAVMCVHRERDQRPEFVGAARGDHAAELGRPIAFVAEVVAPGEHAQREAMQHVLLGEADRAVHLMRDRGAFLRRPRRERILAAAASRNTRVVECVACARSRRRPSRQRRARPRPRRRAARGSAAPPGIFRSAARRRRARWRSAPLIVEDRFERAGGLHAAHRRSPSASARSASKPAGAGAMRSGLHAIERHGVRWHRRRDCGRRPARQAVVSTSAIAARPRRRARRCASRRLANGTPRARAAQRAVGVQRDAVARPRRARPSSRPAGAFDARRAPAASRRAAFRRAAPRARSVRRRRERQSRRRDSAPEPP